MIIYAARRLHLRSEASILLVSGLAPLLVLPVLLPGIEQRELEYVPVRSTVSDHNHRTDNIHYWISMLQAYLVVSKPMLLLVDNSPRQDDLIK